MKLPKMKIYSSEQTGRDGQQYSVRYMLDGAELAGLQAAGLVPRDVCEIVGMHAVADGIIAEFERDAALMTGAVLQ